MKEILIALSIACLIIIYVIVSISISYWPISILLIALLIFIIIKYQELIKITSKIKKNNNTFVNEYFYKTKPFMTSNELMFYYKIIDLEEKYNIVPQINLASIIEKINKKKYQSELYRNIDFAIFTKDYKELLLLIELNDSTHNNPDRIKRDKKVREICKKANVKLITFYTQYSNEKGYVIDRILKNINQNYE